MLEARRLMVRYATGALGVADVSLAVEPGKVTALFGPNGAGKTTSVRACSGFLKTEGARVVRGDVSVDGRRLTSAEPHTFCRLGVALVPERQKIFPRLSVAENLAALGRLPPRRERSAAYGRVFSLFPALQETLRRQAGHLSGGQQQMLAIGRALLSEPRYLVIDEMTLGLHVSLVRPLFEALREIADGGTGVLVVDESTDAALEIADHCYVMRAGRIADEGPPERFRDRQLVAAGYIGG